MSERAGRPPFEANDKQRNQVVTLAQVGIPEQDIATVIGIARNTLRKHFKEELAKAAVIANAAVGGALYSNAMDGNVAAQIWWTKARMGWREKTSHELTGPDGGPIEIDVDASERLNRRLAEEAARILAKTADRGD